MMIAKQLTRKAIELSTAGLHKDAHKTFVDVIRLRPDDGDAWLNLGICCTVSGDTNAAVEAFERAIALEPQNTAAYTNLASTWASKNQPEIAMTILERGLALNTKNLSLLIAKGVLLAKIGELSQATALLAQAHTLQPEDFTAALIFSELLIQQQRFADAINILKNRECTHKHLLARYYLAQGRAFHGSGDFSAAKAAMINAINEGATEANDLLEQLERGWGTCIASKRVVMQALNTSHAQQVFGLQGDSNAWSFYNPQGITASNVSAIEREIQSRYETRSLHPKELAWAVFRRDKNAETFLGLCQLVHIDHKNSRAELLMMQKTGNGYGVDVLVMIANACFVQYRLNKLVVLIVDVNYAVLDMAIRLGFKQEGHLQKHLFNPVSAQYTGLVQLALFKEDFEQSNIIQQLIQRFEISVN